MPSSMDNTHQVDTSHGTSQNRGYEIRDANTGAVLGFLASLFVVLVAIFLGTWLLFRYYAVVEQQPAPGSSFAGVRQLPVGPELQVNPRQELLNFYAEQQRQLDSYSWEDRKAGTVRIPINRAVDLLLQKGLPVLPSGAASNPAQANPGMTKSNRAVGAPSSGHEKIPGGNE